jgi:lipoprotein-releasing system permease protein
MYQALLVRKYLLSKIMPLLAAAAVLLCTTMVLVTWSVMGGFLNMLVSSGRTMSGDVIVTWPNVGFAHYDDLVKRLESDPMIAAAAPTIETFALLGLPNGRKEMVMVRGVETASYARVTEYDKIQWWRPLDKPLRKDENGDDVRLKQENLDVLNRAVANSKSLTRTNPLTGEAEPAVVMGIEVSGFNARQPEGYYDPQRYIKRDATGNAEPVNEFLPNSGHVVMSVLPLDSDARVVGEQASMKMAVANEFHSGVYELDSKVVIAPLATLQKMLRMDAVKAATPAPASDDEDGFATGIGSGSAASKDTPARVTHVIVRGKADYGKLGTSEPLVDRVRAIYAEFEQAHPGQVPGTFDVSVLSWEDQNRTLINAVKKETGLVLFLFSLISLTAAFLVLAIFWSMIAEKTKDIGIMRALGASRWGVAGVWLGYGVVIGVVGALLGLGVGTLIIRNINPIHEWLGSALGLTIWDPRIYYFTEIPNALNVSKAAIVCLGGVACSVLGALIPSWRAARMDPVRALRFE